MRYLINNSMVTLLPTNKPTNYPSFKRYSDDFDEGPGLIIVIMLSLIMFSLIVYVIYNNDSTNNKNRKNVKNKKNKKNKVTPIK